MPSSCPWLTFSLNASRPGVVVRSGFVSHKAVLADVALATEASCRSLSAAFCTSVRLRRFAKRSKLSLGGALLSHIPSIILDASHAFCALAGVAARATPTRVPKTTKRIEHSLFEASPGDSSHPVGLGRARRISRSTSKVLPDFLLKSRDVEPHHRKVGASLQEVRLLLDDARVERLELEPAREWAAHDLISLRGDVGRNELQALAVPQRRLGDELHLAGALHRDEPPHRLIDRSSDREQAVVLQDRSLLLADRFGYALALVEFDRHPAEIVIKRVVVIEGANVLGDRRERAPERRKSASVGRMRMGGCVGVWPRGMDARMNDERGRVDRIVALDNIALVIAADQVRSLDLAEMDA